MKCKFCNADLEDGVTLCPFCGKENQEEIPAQEEITTEEEISAQEETPIHEETPAQEEGLETDIPAEELPEPPKKKKTVRIVAGILAGITLLSILAGAVLYGAGVNLKPRPNDIFKKDSYTVADQKAEKQKDTVVATLGDKKLTNGELKIYYEMNKSNFLRYYGSYVSMIGLDPNKPMDAQIQDQDTGLTWQQFFLQNSIENWQRYAVMGMLAQEEGFKPTETATEQMAVVEKDLKQLSENAGFASIQEMITGDMGAGATEEGYLGYMRTYYESLDYYDTVFERIQPTDEEVEKYYTENEAVFTKDKMDKTAGKYVDVRHILIMPKDGTQDENGQTTYTEEQWQAAFKDAQTVLEQWKAGEATEASFAELAMKLSADGGSRQNGGLYTNVVKGQMVKPFEDWCFDETREKGNTDIVKTDYGYHIMYFVGSQEIWKAEATSRLVTDRTESMLKDGMERWPMEVHYNKIGLSLLASEKPKDPTEPTTAVTTAPAATEPAADTTAAPAEN